MRNKGKVYPSPSSSTSSSSSSSSIPTTDSLSILKLLPAAILALVSVLSLEDREVFAYMITRSMKSANSPTTMIIEEEEKKKKKINKKSNSNSNTHKPPVFDCDCFDCYTSYWFRWDSSLDRELIHQAIEAFEDHLATGEQSKRTNSNGNKRRERMGRRGNEKQLDVLEERESIVAAQVDYESFVVEIMGGPPDKSEDGGEEEDEVEEEVTPPPAVAVVVRSTVENNHRGLARKVLPDVVGLLNSRLWSLWSPNV